VFGSACVWQLGGVIGVNYYFSSATIKITLF